MRRTKCDCGGPSWDRVLTWHFPNDRLDMPRQFLAHLLRVFELGLVLAPPLRRHVGSEIGRRHQLAFRLEPRRCPTPHRHDVAKEERGAAGVHDVRDFAFEMGETLIEHRDARLSFMMRDSGQLVLIPPAEEAEPVHDIRLLGVQQVHGEASRLVNHVVTVVELVDVDRQARHGRNDRGAHRGVGDHPVLFAVALLDVLNGLANELGLSIVVAHVDHGIQSDSPTVRQSVAVLAKKYRLPFETTELHLGPEASETEARRARYVWLREVQMRRGAKYIVTAHHADDQVETILLRVLRGSAPAGLAGISAKSRGGLVRPLLPFSRAELGGYASACGLAVHGDPANRDARRLRAWLSTTQLPVLSERMGAGVLQDVRLLGRHAARERRAWDRALDLVPDLALGVHEKGFAVARATLCGYDNALSVALLRAAARRVGLVLGPAKARTLVEFA